jgi:hypothetical protein
MCGNVDKMYVSVHVVRILCVYIVDFLFDFLSNWVKMIITVILEY